MQSWHAFLWDQGDGDLSLGRCVKDPTMPLLRWIAVGEKVPPETLNWKETGARTGLRFKFPLPVRVSQL